MLNNQSPEFILQFFRLGFARSQSLMILEKIEIQFRRRIKVRWLLKIWVLFFFTWRIKATFWIHCWNFFGFLHSSWSEFKFKLGAAIIFLKFRRGKKNCPLQNYWLKLVCILDSWCIKKLASWLCVALPNILRSHLLAAGCSAAALSYCRVSLHS